MAFTYSKIATYTVGSGGIASIDFINIPSTYTDLVVKFSLRDSTGNDYIGISYNNSSSTFTSRWINGSGSSATSSSRSDFLFSATSNPSGATANTFSSGELYLPNYSSSTNKSFLVDTATETNATATEMQLVASLWSTPSAISWIKLTAAVSFVQHSTAHLYGIKAEI